MAFDTSGGGSNVGEGGGGGVGVGIGVVGGSGNGTGDGDGRCWSIVVNTTIFLPISEGTFVDADDLLLAWH